MAEGVETGRNGRDEAERVEKTNKMLFYIYGMEEELIDKGIIHPSSGACSLLWSWRA